MCDDETTLHWEKRQFIPWEVLEGNAVKVCKVVDRDIVVAVLVARVHATMTRRSVYVDPMAVSCERRREHHHHHHSIG